MLGVAMMATAATKTNFTLVIDAGHGGGDSGAVGAISKEKNLTLKFALAFGRLVEENCPDVKVVYTRKTDKFVELYRRAEIANQNKADLFISIHINSLYLSEFGLNGWRGVLGRCWGSHRLHVV